jgi:hypothetical protein
VIMAIFSASLMTSINESFGAVRKQSPDKTTRPYFTPSTYGQGHALGLLTSRVPLPLAGNVETMISLQEYINGCSSLMALLTQCTKRVVSRSCSGIVDD